KILTEKDLVKIGHWAYQMYEQKIDESDNRFYDILLDIAVMEYGSEYFLSYDQLDKIIDELLRSDINRKYTKINFCRELKAHLRHGKSQVFIGHWAYTLWMEDNFEDKHLENIVYTLMFMETDEQFERSYKEFNQIADKLIEAEEVKYLKEFENIGLLKVLKKVVKNDCVYTEFLLPYSKTPIKKTFYPEYWSKMDIIDVIKKAVSNPYKIEFKGDFNSCLNKKLYSRFENGIEMISYLRRESIGHAWDIKSSFISKDWILQ
ncbi:hypothetical protein HYV10_01585, partial [Candidatus Dependentiae bacterium]|nr:hypothetical protein [Candidatus Dependentiae bacterium]